MQVNRKQQQPLASTSSRVALEPVPATIVAENERRRRSSNRDLGPCRSGCAAIDDYVLLGGLERGCVVGLSAEREDFGITLGLQFLMEKLLSGQEGGGALVITPRPQAEMSGALLRGVRAAGRSGEARSLLARVMVSQVFDLDGVWEVLADLDRPPEIGDSQDDEAGGTPPPPPDVIVVTHAASLLASTLTHRPGRAGHAAIRHLSSRLRHVSRALPSSPLVLLLNGVSGPPPDAAAAARARPAAPPEQTLRSVFGAGGAARRTKPAFGNLFAQMLDVHILCTMVPRGPGDADMVFAPRRQDSAAPAASPTFVTVVEVLLDDMGVWDHDRVEGRRRSREQRWGAAHVRGGRVVDAFPGR